MKLVSFDLEIAKAVEGHDWQAQRPLGISCAAVMTSQPHITYGDTHFWHTHKDFVGDMPPAYMSVEQCRSMVRGLMGLAADGFTIVTVNGAGFDFAVLAEESGMVAECADLAINYHCDLMLISVCNLGWRVGLESLAIGAGVKGKLHNVTLSDGRIIDNMSGAMAPQMWQQGERDAVLAYLKDDVRSTLETAVHAVKYGNLGWYSSKGRWWSVKLPDGRLPTVAECLTWPRPDTSWMSDPIDPDALVAWTR